MRFAARRSVAAINRRAWNEIAALWARRPEHRRIDARFFRRGRSTLWPEERRLMGPVRGRALLHLMCGAGEDTLSWANLGAKATGVDIAERRLDLARARARAAGLEARFVRAGVSRLPFPDRSFDRVYTSRGALVWVPSLRAWARQIARVLKPDGRFLLCDEHPFLYCLVQRGRRAPVVGWDYFEQRARIWRGWWFARGRAPNSRKAETDWKLSDTLNALAGAGLALVRALESPEPSALDFRLPARRRGILPQTLMLLFRKPAARRSRPATS